MSKVGCVLLCDNMYVVTRSINKNIGNEELLEMLCVQSERSCPKYPFFTTHVHHNPVCMKVHSAKYDKVLSYTPDQN